MRGAGIRSLGCGARIGGASHCATNVLVSNNGSRTFCTKRKNRDLTGVWHGGGDGSPEKMTRGLRAGSGLGEGFYGGGASRATRW